MVALKTTVFFISYVLSSWLIRHIYLIEDSSINQKNDLVVSSSFNSHLIGGAGFESITVDALRDIINPKRSGSYAPTIPIVVHLVTASNKHLLPPFAVIHFEFHSLSATRFILNGDITKTDYHEMLQRVIAASNGVFCVTVNNHEPILNVVVHEFAARNQMKLKITNTHILSVDSGSAIHYDGRGLSLWIPITDTLIDNLCLGVGDITALNHPQCALPKFQGDKLCSDGSAFQKVVWYQQMTMTSEDWIFFRGDKVPHFSVNLGNTLRVQQRSALVINLESDES